MGLFGGRLEIETLRAVEYARLLLASGVGLETVVHALSRAELGGVARRFGRVLRRMDAGEPAAAALERAHRKARNRAYALFLEALLAGADERRLDDTATRIAEEARTRSQRRLEALGGWLKAAQILGLVPFASIGAAVWSTVPSNPFLPTRAFLPSEHELFFVVLGGAYCLLVLAMGVRG